MMLDTTTPNNGADFESAVAFVLEREGGYVNDPADPGGETKYGISKRKFPGEDIKNLTVEQAKELYYKHYWLEFHCDTLPWPMSLLVFDTAVNMHPSVVEGLKTNSTDWFDFMFRRLYQYALIAMKKRDGQLKSLKFLPGWVIRVYHLYRFMRKTTEQKAKE